MLKKVKNALIVTMLASSLAACATGTQENAGGMKMDRPMCKEMMEQKKCCCPMMQNQDAMRTSGMMTGGDMKMMQCKPAETAAPAAADHEEHHPADMK